MSYAALRKNQKRGLGLLLHVCLALTCAYIGTAAPRALAQPAMLDPSQMSGIPRPDPQVPPATVTVRLIRGELANRLPNVDVELVDVEKAKAGDKAATRTVKTDAEGRATFPELPAAVYEARAVLEGETLTSQPIQVAPAPNPGIRVMLVFAKSLADQQKELGTPDGKARVDTAAPPGTLTIKTFDESGKPLPGLRVGLFRAQKENEQVESLPPQTTDAEGATRFSGLMTSPGTAYLATVQRDNAEHRSQPFRLVPEHGSQLALTVLAVTRDTAALQIGLGSHIILELQDDSVSVLENLRIVNPLPQAIDPGPGGLRIPLAEGALSPQTLQGGPPNVTVDASQDGPPQAVWKGPVPPGDSEVRVTFLLKHRGHMSFKQEMRQSVAGLRLVMEKLPDVHFDGVTDLEERKWNGRDLVLGSVAGGGVGGHIEFGLSGLPADVQVVRWVAGLLALAVGLLFTWLAMYGRPATDQAVQKRRQKLQQRRDALLGEVLKAEEREAEAGKIRATAPAGKPDKNALRTSAQVVAELEQVYRELDELDGA